ncbi:hypothetical protein STTU_1582 [Streptomyces sp. Tu6071]|nr:hypothetical protein STTU_1582 [Streptomyces sp. Tu6071]
MPLCRAAGSCHRALPGPVDRREGQFRPRLLTIRGPVDAGSLCFRPEECRRGPKLPNCYGLRGAG